MTLLAAGARRSWSSGSIALLTSGAIALMLAAILAGTAIGETPISLGSVFATLANRLAGGGYAVPPIDEGIIWNYRLTRAIVALCCGAALAVSGLVLQSLLRNALADPYILGISAGASTGAVGVMVAGLGAGLISISLGAFMGAILAFAFVAILAQAAGGGAAQRATGLIILAGVAGSQLFNAITSFVIAHSASAEQVRGITFWLLGNLSSVRWPDVQLAFPVALFGIIFCCWHRRALDAFEFGSESAASLGVPVRRIQIMLVGTVALMTATMVSIVGSIGFVGLVIPHAARFLVGVRHGRLLPVSAITGGLFLVLADIVSRVIVPGQVLPIGVVTALVGAPAFAIILVRSRRSA